MASTVVDPLKTASNALPTDLGDYFLGYSQPQAGFFKYLQSQGLGGQDRRSQYAQDQYGNAYTSYLSQVPANPGQSFYGYLQATHPNYTQQYGNQSAPQRGVISQVSTPRVHWIL